MTRVSSIHQVFAQTPDPSLQLHDGKDDGQKFPETMLLEAGNSLSVSMVCNIQNNISQVIHDI